MADGPGQLDTQRYEWWVALSKPHEVDLPRVMSIAEKTERVMTSRHIPATRPGGPSAHDERVMTGHLRDTTLE